MAAQIRIYNGPMPTTSVIAPVALTAATLKTLIQVKASATLPFRVKAWGISLDASAAAVPGSVELIQTDVAATVTAFVAADFHKKNGEALALGDVTTNLLPVGTTSSGYTASAEGTTTASRVFDAQLVAPTNQFIYQFPLGDEPVVEVSKFLRIRAKFAAGVNALCWVDIEL